MSIILNVLPVGAGDCIHLRFVDNDSARNIIIDSGPSNKKAIFRGLLNHIKSSNEKVDLLCFTHIDNDHIRAASLVFADYEESFDYINEVWINTVIPDKINHNPDYTLMSIDEALDLSRHLLYHRIPIKTDIIKGYTKKVGSAELKVVSPTEESHKNYLEYWTNNSKNTLMSADTSKSNGDSIAFVFSFDNTSILFTGDSHNSVLIDGLDPLGANEKIKILQLPHHGSIRNISAELLEKTNSETFFISSNGAYPHPSPETFELIDKYKPDVEKTILGNFTLPFDKNIDNIQFINITENEYIFKNKITIKSEKYNG